MLICSTSANILKQVLQNHRSVFPTSIRKTFARPGTGCTSETAALPPLLSTADTEELVRLAMVLLKEATMMLDSRLVYAVFADEPAEYSICVVYRQPDSPARPA